MKLRIVLFIVLFFLCPIIGHTQDCVINFSGFILDKSTHIPLPYSTVYLEEHYTGAVSDSVGFFQLEGLCAKEYHLRLSHIGCETEHLFVNLTQDTLIRLYLEHHNELLDEAVVHGEAGEHSTQVSSTISNEAIAQESNKNLSDVLENITGVSSLKTGTSVSKPVIHGLYGNRVAILNNGIVQSGQQWGNDHAPEIDPFLADHLAVVKGASALAYGGNSLGGVVLVEMNNIKQDPHLHGKINYLFQTNGRGHTFNTRLEQFGKWAAWRMTGTFKKIGDYKTPNHYLTNTGKQELNGALQIDKKFNSRLHTNVYYSLFNTEIGVLRGSHIGNLTDLSEALEREIPFYTEDKFSYQINAPRQKVQHHLFKFTAKYFIEQEKVLNFTYGFQLNNRKEFDVRRGGRTETPTLSLQQYTNFTELVYQQAFKEDYFLKVGGQFNFVDNNNNPETGISPLIPNYQSYQSAAFFILQRERKRWFYEFGARYDWKHLRPVTITQTFPRAIERFYHHFHNYSLSAGSSYHFTEQLKGNFNIGYVLRAPEINELYSSGLHQGVSGIEGGQRDLTTEKSLKAVLSADFSFSQKFFIQALGYWQNIQDFIYLQPQNDFRLTIRGAFPVFLYQQTNARLYGTDLLLAYEPQVNIKFVAKYAMVRGRDITNNTPLINMPSDNLLTSIDYSFKESNLFKNSFLSLNGRYVFRQNSLLEEQDFVAPPDAYFLLGLKAGTSLQRSESSIEMNVSVENVLNHSYRDYLNRQRYFADEIGRNIVFRMSYNF